MPPHHRIFVRKLDGSSPNEFVCNGGGITYTCDSQFKVLKKAKSKFTLESLRPPACASCNLGMIAGHLYSLDGEEPKRVRILSVDEKDQELFSVRLQEDKRTTYLCYYVSGEQSIYRYDVSTKKSQLLTVLKFPVDEIISVGKDAQCLAHVRASDISQLPELECRGDGWYLLDFVAGAEKDGETNKVSTLVHFVAPEKLAGRTLVTYDEQNSSFVDVTTNQTFKAKVSFSLFQDLRALYEEID